VLQLSVNGIKKVMMMNTGKKFEQRFFYFTIYLFTLFSSYEGANNNSSVKFSCRFFVDFDVFQISLMFLADR